MGAVRKAGAGQQASWAGASHALGQLAGISTCRLGVCQMIACHPAESHMAILQFRKHGEKKFYFVLFLLFLIKG